MVSETGLAELVPQLQNVNIDPASVLARVRNIVDSLWGEAPDPVLAMALQIAVQLPATATAALVAIDALEKAIKPTVLAA